MSQLEREEEGLEQAYADGYISIAEFNEEMRDLHRAYRCTAEEAAHEAYDREMERW